jgi:hypothetical protein
MCFEILNIYIGTSSFILFYFILFLKLRFSLNLKPFPCIKKILKKKRKKEFSIFPLHINKSHNFWPVKAKK